MDLQLQLGRTLAAFLRTMACNVDTQHLICTWNTIAVLWVNGTTEGLCNGFI